MDVGVVGETCAVIEIGVERKERNSTKKLFSFNAFHYLQCLKFLFVVFTPHSC